MKPYKYLAAIMIAMAALTAGNATAKEKKAAKMYVFGIATSFNDSTAYFTPIQEIDSVTTVGRTSLLANKQEYSYQLRDYFASIGMPHKTCATVNNTNKKKIEKLYNKTKLKMTKKSNYIIKDLSDSEFKFERIVMAH